MARDDPLDTQEFDNRPGIFLAHEMPENIKIAALSDAAFRTLVKAWCYCSRVRTNGVIPKSVWDSLGTPKARRELLSPPTLAPDKAPLFRPTEGGIIAHDYLKHNRSSEEIVEVSAARARGGAKGQHTRWHVARRRWNPECEWCQQEGRVPESA